MHRQVVCLGDLVGYNAFPRETLALMRARRIASVHGNHDLMALNWLPIEGGLLEENARLGLFAPEPSWFMRARAVASRFRPHDSR